MRYRDKMHEYRDLFVLGKERMEKMQDRVVDIVCVIR